MSVSISTVNVGASANDGTGDDIRDAFIKVNSSLANLKSGIDGQTVGSANVVLAKVGNLQVTNRVIGSLYLSGSDTIYINGSPVTTAGNAFTGGSVAGVSSFISANTSNSSSSGAVTITGGLGVGGNIYSGGLGVFSGNLLTTSAIDASSTTNAALISLGGLGVVKSAYIGQNLYLGGSSTITGTLAVNGQTTISTADVSTNISTGALVVTGGMGVGGNINAGGSQHNLSGNVTVAGNLTVNGNTIFGSQTLSVTDNIIDLHSPVNLAPLTMDDGKDVGIQFHYYKAGYGDSRAALVWANDTSDLEYYGGGAEQVSGVFSGTYGTYKGGGFWSVNATPSTSTTTGAIITAGGIGAAGNINVGGNIVAAVGVVGSYYGLIQTAIQPNITGLGTLSQLTVGGTTTTGNIITTNGIFWANGMAFASSLYSNANVASYLVANPPSGTYSNANVAAYLTAGSYSNVNTAAYLSGTITVGNIITTQGVFWSNGATALGGSGGLYSNVQVAQYLPTYSGSVAGLTVSGQLNLTNASNWNLYASGAGTNFLAGNTGVGTNTLQGVFTVGSATASGTTDDMQKWQWTGSTTNYGLTLSQVHTGTTIDYAFKIQNSSATKDTRFYVASNGTLSLGASPGSESLRVVPVASAVNYLAAYGAATTASPALYSLGSDTNIDVNILPKGNGGIFTYGVGQTTSSIDTTKLGSGIGLFDSGVATGNGGSIIFGAASGTWRFAAIKAAVINGGNNSQGDLYFSTRRVATDSTLTPAMQITSGGVAYLGGSSGNQSLQVNPVASAVNYVQVAGAATGVAPVLSAQGSDANVSMIYTSKGTYGQGFYTNNGGQQQFSIAHTASAVNYLTVTGAVTGDGPSLTSSGSDANINLKYLAKGTGYHFFYGISTPQFAIAPTASAVNYLQATGAATGSGVTLSAQGTDSSVNINLTPKGTGSVVVSGNVVPSANVSYNLGSSTAWWNTMYGVSSQAKYADLAEKYLADSDYAPGTVVVFGGSAEITTTDIMADTAVAGVISTDPAYLMNATIDGLPVALRGRVPVQVVGTVLKGDLLVTSTTPGYARSVGKDKGFGVAVFAKSLENKSTGEPGVIEAVIL
jgi:hypothetical protein